MNKELVIKAVTYNKEQDLFSLSEIPVPELETEFDVLVKVLAVGLNPVDAKVNRWHPRVPDMDEQFVCGLDVSGEIVAVGQAVQDWKVGDRVLYHGNMLRSQGGFAEFALHDSRTLIAHPDMSPESAASIPCAAWTAYRALVDKLRIGERRSLLILGGSGGVGSFAIQIARHFGVETIITTCSEANHEYVHSLGATHAIDYRSQDPVAQVMAITQGEGVEVALDCVGGDNELIASAVLGYEGELLELVQTVNPERYRDAFLRGLTMHQLSLGSGHGNGDIGRQGIAETGKRVSALLETGDLELPAIKVIDLERVGEALVGIREQRTVGKIVARIGA